VWISEEKHGRARALYLKRLTLQSANLDHGCHVNDRTIRSGRARESNVHVHAWLECAGERPAIGSEEASLAAYHKVVHPNGAVPFRSNLKLVAG
jgi:hypothetical protein